MQQKINDINSFHAWRFSISGPYFIGSLAHDTSLVTKQTTQKFVITLSSFHFHRNVWSSIYVIELTVQPLAVATLLSFLCSHLNYIASFASIMNLFVVWGSSTYYRTRHCTCLVELYYRVSTLRNNQCIHS